MAGSAPLAVGAAGLAHGATDGDRLGRALLGAREGGFLVVEVGGLATEDKGEDELGVGHDWRSPWNRGTDRDAPSSQRGGPKNDTPPPAGMEVRNCRPESV